jgi:hypothetical protein
MRKICSATVSPTAVVDYRAPLIDVVVERIYAGCSHIRVRGER